MSIYRRYYQLREAFRATFWRGLWKQESGHPTEYTRDVLNELREFCRADASCVQFSKDGRVDTHLTAVIEGRREVWLKLCALLSLSESDLLKLRGQDDE